MLYYVVVLDDLALHEILVDRVRSSNKPIVADFKTIAPKSRTDI